MKKLLFFFLMGVLCSLTSCTKDLPHCPATPTHTGLALLLLGRVETHNNYRLDIYHDEAKPTRGSYFDVKVTPQGQAFKTYKAYANGNLTHGIPNGDL